MRSVIIWSGIPRIGREKAIPSLYESFILSREVSVRVFFLQYSGVAALFISGYAQISFHDQNTDSSIKIFDPRSINTSKKKNVIKTIFRIREFS